MNLLKALTGATNQEDARTREFREAIRREAKIGGELFGPIPPDGRREFFCLNERTWVWHEERVDQQGIRQSITTRYDVRPTGILKAQDGRPYQYIGYDEAKRFSQAVRLYNKRVHAELYPTA